VLLFVRSGETTVQTGPTLSSTTRSVQVAGVLLKGSCKSHTFQELCCEQRNSILRDDSRFLALPGATDMQQNFDSASLCLATVGSRVSDGLYLSSNKCSGMSTGNLYLARRQPTHLLDPLIFGATDCNKTTAPLIFARRQTTLCWTLLSN
jgi:hypothetical protein